MINDIAADQAQDYWKCIENRKNIILYGGGDQGKRVCKLLLEKGIVPVAVCDGNNALIGKRFCGSYVIQSYEDIRKRYADYNIIITTSPVYAYEITEFLRGKGEQNPVCNMMVPFKVDDTFLDYEEVRKQRKYAEVYELLEDSASKEVWLENIQYKMSGDGMRLWNLINGDTFFDRDILGGNIRRYVDVGAYTGDTCRQFLEFAGGAYEKIIAIEADKGNYAALEKFIQYGAIERIRTVCLGVWSEKGEKTYYTTAGNSEINYDSSNLFRSVDKNMDNKVKRENSNEMTKAIEEIISVDTLDNILENEQPTIIKINALAADYPILVGAESTIRSCKPAIIMEYGVRPSYILDEILWLHKLNLEYRFLLRQKRIFNDSKTVLYAV